MANGERLPNPGTGDFKRPHIAGLAPIRSVFHRRFPIRCRQYIRMLIDDLRQCFQQMVNAFIRNKSSGKQDDAPPVPSVMSKSGFPQCLGRRAEGRGKMLQTDSEMIDRNFIRQLRMPYRDIFQQNGCSPRCRPSTWRCFQTALAHIRRRYKGIGMEIKYSLYIREMHLQTLSQQRAIVYFDNIRSPFLEPPRREG